VARLGALVVGVLVAERLDVGARLDVAEAVARRARVVDALAGVDPLDVEPVETGLRELEAAPILVVGLARLATASDGLARVLDPALAKALRALGARRGRHRREEQPNPSPPDEVCRLHEASGARRARVGAQSPHSCKGVKEDPAVGTVLHFGAAPALALALGAGSMGAGGALNEAMSALT
jgi:hypothetical protein